MLRISEIKLHFDRRRPQLAKKHWENRDNDYLIMRIKIFLTLILSGLFLGTIQAQSFSTLKNDKLKGNVKSVRKEQTWTTKKNAKYVESEKVLMTIDNYDKNGKKTEWLGYSGKDYPIKFVFVCDDEGKLSKELSYNYLDEVDVETLYKYNENGMLAEEIISNGIKTVYAYDSNNNKKSETTYDLATDEGGRSFGSVERVLYFHYYKNNKLKEIGAYNLDGSRIWSPPLQAHRIVYAYDSKGQIAFETVFNKDNSIRSKARYFYDLDKVLIKEFSFIDYNKFAHTYKYEYEFDETGNWTKQIKSQQMRIKKKLIFIPIETVYRTIVYH